VKRLELCQWAIVLSAAITVLALFGVMFSGCGGRSKSVADAITAARFACELYPYGPPESRTPEADAICPLLAPDAFKAADAGGGGAPGAAGAGP
jgi:hypothetical protein